MTELLAAYPQGEPLCHEVTPDGRRLFVAEGAVIAVLDVEPIGGVITPVVLQSIEMPEASPMVMRYFYEPNGDTHHLFVAGGSHGPWRLDLCSTLFDPVPVPCGAAALQSTPIEPNLTTLPKRCVDVEVVTEHDAGVPLLFAVYAANSNPNKSSVGPSELRGYRINADGTMPAWGSPFVFPSTATNDPKEQVATALTWVPGISKRLYAALGVDWIWSIDISIETSITGARMPTGTIPLCSLTSCPAGENARDVFGVQNAAGNEFVYAVLEYGRVLEYRIATGAVAATAITCMSGADARLESISAAMEGNRVFVGVGLPALHGRVDETRAPYHPTGLWNDPCYGVGLADPNADTGGGCNELRFLMRCTASSGSLTPLSHTTASTLGSWNSLILRRTDEWTFSAYSSTQSGGTTVHELAPVYSSMSMESSSMSMQSAGFPLAPCGPVPLTFEVELIAEYLGISFPIAAGTTSLRDPGLTYFGHDGLGIPSTALQVHVRESPRDLLPVPWTISVCDQRTTPIPRLIACDGTDQGSGDPNPFAGSILGTARWLDPVDEEAEWFLPGGSLWRRANPATCTPWPAGECSASLCSAPEAWIRRGFVDGGTNVGWKLVRLLTANPSQALPSGQAMDMKWWQCQLPAGPDPSRSDDIPYFYSLEDARRELLQPGDLEPVPVLVHSVRSGSDYGYKLQRPQDLMALSAQTCSQMGLGYGESLEADPTTQFVPFLEAITHPEFETPGPGLLPCLVHSCDGSALARNIYNGKCDVFALEDLLQQERHVAVVAAGFVATDYSVLTPDCRWDDYAKRLLVIAYDVTNSPAEFLDPTPEGPPILRVFLGPVGGGAFALKVKSYETQNGPRSYAFVADFSGSLLVYDVSASVLFAEAAVPPGSPYLPTRTPVLTSTATVNFDPDPYDGIRPDVVDIAIEGDYAYCALSRAGVGVVDISNPFNPVLITVLDTPGLAQGLALRRDSLNRPQLLVGDSRAGIRLYGIPGE